MSLEITRSQAIRLYCLFRKAERSIDHALQPGCPWDLLREYYNPERSARIEAALEMLRAMTDYPGSPSDRADVYSAGIGLLLTSLVRLFINRIRISWRFRSVEAQFFLQTLQRVLDFVRAADRPDQAKLVELRMDLACCEWVIERRLLGLPVLERALWIENFGQTDFRKHYTLDEILPEEVPAFR